MLNGACCSLLGEYTSREHAEEITSKKLRNSEGEFLQDKVIVSPYEAMNIREIGALSILQILHRFPQDGEDIF
ncbi:hypothetical protein HKD37_15G042556 [Glycine soja]